jgi:hypothetical protein
MLRYRLDDLGWYQFECMVQSLLKANLGLAIESWAGRGDHGRDAFYKGQLDFPTKGHLQEGPFIFQVKFIEEANAAGANPRPRLISALNSEIKRLERRRASKKNTIVYSLFTNVFLSPELREELREILINRFPLFNVVVMGGQDICDLLDNSPNIRISFPQILSLRDLDSLLNEIVAKPIIERSRGMIEEAREISSIFYPTNAYNETLRKLALNNFAVLEGPPEVGKTAIANMIGLCRLSIGWDAFECLSPNEFFQLFSIENQQIFVADDAFGSTEYDPARTNEWSHNLDRILRRLDHNHWLIWTARKHILEIALQRMRLQGKGENFPEPSSIIIDAGNLTKTEKAMILYRHAKAAGFEYDARNLLKKYAELIVSDAYFTPERIRRFVQNSFPFLIKEFNAGNLTLEDLNQLITKEIKEPTKSLRQAFDCLSEGHKSLLISRLDLDQPEILTEPKELSKAFERHQPQVIDKSYEQLEADLSLSFLKKTSSSDLFFFDGGWVHPSMRDLVINYLVNNRNSRIEFLSKCSLGGISLALSIGGGSEGTRTFPLITDMNDQAILIKRIEDLIKIINLDKLVLLLETISAAKIKVAEIEDIEIIKIINDIFEVAIDNLLLRWNTDKNIIDIRLVNLYYKIVKDSRTYRPPPPLKYTWDKIFGKMAEATYYSEDYVETGDWSEMDQFLDFVHILIKEEPRFLRYVNFPECFSKLASNFITACINYSKADYSIFSDSISNYELYSFEAEKFNELNDIVERIFDLEIRLEIEIRPSEVLELIADAASKWEERAQQEYEPEQEEESYHSSADGDYVDIEAIFSDL